MTVCFRAVLFRMVPKQKKKYENWEHSFRAVLFQKIVEEG